MSRRSLLVLLAVLAGGLVSVSAGSDVSSGSLIGLGGYDLLSYRSETGPVPGSDQHVAVHDGVAYRFASEANRAAFAADPERFLPAYDGYCAYAVSYGQKVEADPRVFDVVDGRLYLNFDRSVQRKWRKDVPGYIEKADARWPQIESVPASEL